MPRFCRWIPPHLSNGEGEPAFGATDLWLLSAVLLWGGNSVASKILLEVVPPLDVIYLRMIGVALLLLPALFMFAPPRATPRSPAPLLVLIASVVLVVQTFFFFWGLRLTTADISALVFSTGPLWTAVVLAACGFQLFRRRNWLGFALGLGGTALVIFTSHRAQAAYAPAPFLGAVATALSAVLFGWYIILTKGAMEQFGALRILAVTYLIGALLVTPWAVVALPHVPWDRMMPLHWAMLAYNLVLAGAYSFAVWYLSIVRANTTRAVLYLYLIPLFAAVAAWFALGEVLSPGQLLGIVVTLGGVYLARPPVSVTRAAPLRPPVV